MRVKAGPATSSEFGTVDIHEGRMLYVLWYVDRDSIQPDEIAKMAACLLSALGQATNKRARNADLSIYVCTLRFPIPYARELNLWGVGFSVIGHEVSRIFSSCIPASWEKQDSGYASLHDMNVQPVARYARGLRIFYREYFDLLNRNAPDLAPSEVRRSVVRVLDFWTPKSPFMIGGEHSHSPEDYESTAGEIDELRREFRSPGRYGSLARILTNHFGFRVYEFDGSMDGRRGFTSIDWAFEKGGFDIRIGVNRSLHPRLKYVVLAHELGHYMLHLDLMILSQLVEQKAWFVSHAEEFYCRLIRRHLSSLREVEMQAHQFASYFLVTERHDEWLADEDYLIGDRLRRTQSAVSVWRSLQPLFSETRSNLDYRSAGGVHPDSLARQEDELSRISVQMGMVDASIYDATLVAALTRTGSVAQMAHIKVRQGMKKISNSLLCGPLERSGPSLRSSVQANTVRDLGAPGRTLISAISPSAGEKSIVRLPLVPAPGGKYYSVLHTNEGERPLEC